MAMGEHTVGFGNRERLIDTLERLRFWSTSAPPSDDLVIVNRLVRRIKDNLVKGRFSLTLNEDELTTFMGVLAGERLPLGKVMDTLPDYNYKEYLPLKESYSPESLNEWESEDYPRIGMAKN